MMAQALVKKITAQKKLLMTVKTMMKPNFWKKGITAPNRKIPAMKVVNAPAETLHKKKKPNPVQLPIQLVKTP